MNIRHEYICPRNKDEFIRYLLVKASPVMLKVKPAVLIRISNCFRAREFQPYEIFCRHQKIILETLGLDYIIMKNNGNDIQVMFYDLKVLGETLGDSDVKSFMEGVKYDSNWSVEKYLKELQSRFCVEDFPHEIGIFLGYPLNDVKGFMSDFSSGVSVPQGRWKIYGDTRKSLNVMNLYRLAEKIGETIIKQYHEIPVCVEKIKCAVMTENFSLGV